jgi:AcrR family transcriptional regulator
MMDKSGISRHERRRLQTRQQLMDAAIALLMEKGYDAVNVQAITERADLGRGTFYIHFKDREDILWAAIKDPILELERQAHKDLAETLQAPLEYCGLLNIYRHADRNRDLYRAILGGKGSAILVNELQDLLARIFLNDIRSAYKGQDPAARIPDEIVAQMLSGAITRLLHWWLDTSNRYNAEKMAALTYQMLYHHPPFADSNP